MCVCVSKGGVQGGQVDRVAVGERLCLKKEERNIKKKRGTSLREDGGNYNYDAV